MNFSRAPEPEEPEYSTIRTAELRRKGVSLNGMFGFQVSTLRGILERTFTWEKSWAASIPNLLENDIKYDTDANGVWPEIEAASTQTVEAVIHRLAWALKSDALQLTPTLIHGDLWELNVGIDMETRHPVASDPGCIYALKPDGIRDLELPLGPSCSHTEKY